ncbi:MAG: ATP-binding protein, partial [Chryseobacterium sp.]
TLLESETRFRSLVEHSPVAMASLKGEDFTVDIVNGAILEIWGKDRSVIGKPLRLALPEIEKQPFLGILKEVYQSGKPFYGQELKVKLLVDQKLTDLYINFVYQPISDTDGKTTTILVVASDVTDQVNARDTVKEINTRLQIALDASSLGSTEVELATGIMQSNNQFKRNFGFSDEEEFAYSDLFEAILPEHRVRVKELVQEAIRTNGIYKTEYPIKWRDGSLHWIQAHGRPRYDENGNGDRMVGMTADITDKKLFEQRKDDFLSIASHELKTPITSLKASLQLLDRMKNKPFSETHIRLIEQSRKSVDKVVVLIDDLLNMSRLSEDQLKLEKTKFNLHDMLSMSCNHVRMEGKYDLIIEGDKNLELYADEHRIDQVVINFVNNAVKYAPESKQINIKIESLEDQVKVSVRDFGKGIDAEILPNLFDRYFRVDHSGKAYSGLGLGLYICSEIIRRHDGKIGAESAIGEGSTFWFTLPV